MISVDSFKQSFDDLANKYQTGAEYGPDAFNRQLPSCVVDIVRSRLGLSEQYRPGQSAPAMAYELTQVITGELSSLKMADVGISVNGYGIAQLPTDYLYPSSLFSIYEDAELKAQYKAASKKKCGHMSVELCGCDTIPMSVAELKMLAIKNAALFYTSQVPVTICDDATFNMMRTNAVRKPSLEYPICRLNNMEIEFAPKNIASAIFTYIRYPKTAKWNYTFNSTTFLATYNPVGSQDIELPATLFIPLMGLLLSRLGISVRESDLVQVGDKLNIQGK